MIDFSNARSIVTPKGEVALIERGGEILFRKQKYKREVAYLESTGTQWIDTGYCPNGETAVECKFQFVGTPAVQTRPFGSNRSGTGTGSKMSLDMYVSSSGDIRYSFGLQDSGAGKWTQFLPQTFPDENIHTWYMDKNIVKYDDAEAKTAVGTVAQSTFPVYLFWCNLNGQGTIQSFVGKIYHTKIWENGILVRDFIPVLDWNDVPCMYDKVSDELFYNQGTGEFSYSD